MKTKIESTRQKERTSMKTACISRIAFLNPRVLTGFALYATSLVAAFGGMSSTLQAQTLGGWKVTGSMVTARDEHTATLLPNGQVLVAGGATATAELYNPATGMWTETGSMSGARAAHTATLLRNGQVLVAGGIGNHQVVKSTELYRPER